jgi:molybdopterin-containing oxidoreductase family molybdopterin binding subunit
VIVSLEKRMRDSNPKEEGVDMIEERKILEGFSRRNFIKGAAVLTATGMLAGCTSAASNETNEPAGEPTVAEETLFAGVCRGNCAGGCFLDIHVRDSQVVRTTARDFPDTQYNRICSKGVSQVGRIYSSERLQYPMKRTGERGAGEFERISWDEAAQEISDKWSAYVKDYGPGSMGIMMGSGNYAICGGTTTIASACQRFQAVTGAAEIPLNVDAANRFSAMFGLNIYGSENEPTDFKNSKTFVIWGSNPSVSQPQIMHFILEAKEQGTKLIVIDPVYNANASKADWYIPVNPSTDGALALGALRELFDQGWQDTEFLRKSTEAPFLIKGDGMFLHLSDLGVKPIEGDVDPATGQPTVIDPYAVWDEETNSAVAITEAKKPALEGITEVGGITVKSVYDVMKEKIAEWTVERASEASGVSVADIKELARVYAQEGPVNTYSMFGDDHYNNGPYNYGPIYSLVLATGNSGKPGAAAGLAEAIPIHVANFAGVLYPVDSAGTLAQGAAPGLLVNQIGPILDTGMFGTQPYTLKGAYITNANPAATMAEREKTLHWLKAIEFLVVADMVMTETATYADILLPVCHWFETVDLFTSYGTHPYLVWQDKAIEPQFESKCDWDIYRLITEKMGYGDYFDMDSEGFIRLWLDSDGAKAMGITFDRVKDEKAVRVLPGETFISYEGGAYTTPSGRARFYQETIVPAYNIGQTIDESKERTFLYWEPALEADVNSPVRASYPFSVLSDHMRTRTHTQWFDVGYMDDYEPDPIVRMSPGDASGLGIREGDIVKLSNSRGTVTMKAAINNGLPKGMVSCPRSFQVDEFIAGHFADISFNAYNQCAANQAFNDVAVSIEKA